MQVYKNIKIDPTKWAQFKHIAIDENKKLQDIIDEVLESYLKDRKTQQEK